jgi:hypothetical protein
VTILAFLELQSREPPCSPTTRQPDFNGLGAIGDSGLEFAQESGAHSVLLFLAEFLEARIAAEWIEIWIEPQERRGKRIITA